MAEPNDAATQLLKKMRVENAKRSSEPRDPYSKMHVFPHKRSRLALACIVFFCFAFMLIARDIGVPKSWMWTALPLIGMGLLFVFLPETEVWVYYPWQSRARQYERHQVEKF